MMVAGHPGLSLKRETASLISKIKTFPSFLVITLWQQKVITPHVFNHFYYTVQNQSTIQKQRKESSNNYNS